MATFNLTIATSLLNDDRPFPIDFDAAWQWCGYGRKADALRKLMGGHFERGLDFEVAQIGANSPGCVSGFEPARRTNNYFLSVDCFKHFAMMAQTIQGRGVRTYFIAAEKAARSTLKENEDLKTKIEMQDVQEVCSIASSIYIEAEQSMLLMLKDLRDCRDNPRLSRSLTTSIEVLNRVLNSHRPAPLVIKIPSPAPKSEESKELPLEPVWIEPGSLDAELVRCKDFCEEFGKEYPIKNSKKLWIKVGMLCRLSSIKKTRDSRGMLVPRGILRIAMKDYP